VTVENQAARYASRRPSPHQADQRKSSMDSEKEAPIGASFAI
jgi:hypothetical protein